MAGTGCVLGGVRYNDSNYPMGYSFEGRLKIVVGIRSMGMLSRVSLWRHRPSSLKHAAAALLLATMPIVGLSAAEAGVQIKGTVKSLRVDVTKTSIAEVLSALEPKFHVRYRSELPLDDEIDGAYRGSLRRVISRLLKDYNYLVKRDGKTMEIVIIEKQQAQPDKSLHPRYRNRRIPRRRIRRYED